jgi:hypothetical protein
VTRPSVGWREWICLPELGVDRIAAKIDTGARTSVLHARDVVLLEDEQGAFVEFTPPLLRRQASVERWQTGGVRRVRARLVDERIVRSSSGGDERRYVIRTLVQIRGISFECEFSLTNRGKLRFPVLLGRSALRGRFLVDVSRPRTKAR